MYPGDDPASMQKRDRTNAVMAQASGKRAVNLILDWRRRYRDTTIRMSRCVLEKKVNGRKNRLTVRRRMRRVKSKKEISRSQYVM
jgi:hypothetical protein